MAKKRRRPSPNAPINQAGPHQYEEAYVSLDSDAGIKAYSKAVNEEFGGFFAGGLEEERAAGTDVSSQTRTAYRDPMTRTDYSAFRPAEQVASGNHKEVIAQVNRAYKKEGMIKNTIDLMGDFAVQGIRIVHPNKKIEKFYQEWWKKIYGDDRSERFVNLLYRQGNIVVRSQTTVIERRIEKAMSKKVAAAKASPDITEEKKAKINKREIPIKYTFLNPVFVDIADSQFSEFQQNPTYVINVPRRVNRKYKAGTITLDKDCPAELRKALITGKSIPLDPDKTSVFFYKKDDWECWADPMIYPLMDNILLLQKLKLSDSAALDGAISNVRIWTIGDFEHKIAPTATAAARLSEALQNNTGAGTMDLVWGPDLKLQESNTNVYKFLGEEKYKPTLNSLYTGLGIPPTLTGTFGSAGTTNNFISLKTLLKRLEYGRGVLLRFWNAEIKKVQEAMGFKLPATIEFDIEALGDEIAEKSLLLQLSDRNLISDELLQRRFGQDPVMEQIRQEREGKERLDGSRLPKSSPYNNPQFGGDLQKIGLQSGKLTPGEVGLSEESERSEYQLKPRRKGEKTADEAKEAQDAKKNTGQPQQGRPKNSNDKTKRKEKTFKPKTKASVEIWAKNAQDNIAKTIVPLFLHQTKKKNLRALSSDEVVMLENIKFKVLYHLNYNEQITEGTIQKALIAGDIPVEVKKVYNEMQASVLQDLNKKTLTLDECKYIQGCVISQVK
ncbi:hypothetical protein KAR91_35590 [Candidatus Pacearchaeota archaeon]|nr:hypothetical protein [Candidatus Pacearchaeota archaeon]